MVGLLLWNSLPGPELGFRIEGEGSGLAAGARNVGTSGYAWIMDPETNEDAALRQASSEPAQSAAAWAFREGYNACMDGLTIADGPEQRPEGVDTLRMIWQIG